MKHRLFKLAAVMAAVAATLTGCWESETARNFVRPVKLTAVNALANYDKEFVGVVSAEQYTNYAFRVGGLINKTYVTEGTFVKKGQLMAELDPGDFILQLEADKAQYQTTNSILQRNKRLLEKQAISQQDYEIAEANYQKAKSGYEYTQNQYEYTKLRAPFSGSVEKKYVENYQKVNAGEPIYKIINPDILEVRFTLPESDINLAKAGRFFVEFDNYRGDLFTVRIKEIVDASVDGAGIPVILAIDDKRFEPGKYNVKAGFACRVRVQVDNLAYNDDLYIVPVWSVFEKDGNNSNRYIWVYDEASKTVVERQVSSHGMVGSDMTIIKGDVKPGDRVVTAGVYQLQNNQKVTVLN